MVHQTSNRQAVMNNLKLIADRHIFNGLYILNVDLMKKRQNPSIKQQR